MRTARAAFIISLPNAVIAAARAHSWTQVETGSAVTWKYQAAFCAVMTRSVSFTRLPFPTICSKSIAARKCCIWAKNIQPYHLQRHFSRALVKRLSRAGERASESIGARNFTQCDSLLIGDKCAAHACLILRRKTSPPYWSMRRRPRKSAMISCFSASSVASMPRKRWRLSSTVLPRCIATFADGICG